MSRLLVDTHALLWWLADDPGLSATARGALAEPANDVLVSAASVDRLLVAQSLVERMPIVSADARFGAYGVDVCW